MSWSRVPGAVNYGVTVDCYGCCVSHQFCSDVGVSANYMTAQPNFTTDFVGDQPGRWRVWAIASDSTTGPPSEWRTFTFGRALDGSIIPPAIPLVGSADVAACGASRKRFPPGTTPPKAIYNPDPEFSEKARKDKLSGTVVLGATLGEDGLVKSVCVARSLRADLDAQAVSAVRTWRFRPATKDGVAVPADLNIEVNFQTLK